MGLMSEMSGLQVISFVAYKAQCVPGESITVTTKIKNISGKAVKVWSVGIGVDARQFTAGLSMRWLTYVAGGSAEQVPISWAAGATKSFTWSANVPQSAENPFVRYAIRSVPLIMYLVSGAANNLDDDVYVSNEVTVLNARFAPRIDAFALARGLNGAEDDEGTNVLATIKLSKTDHDSVYVFDPNCKILYAPKNDPENITSIDLTGEIDELLSGVTDATDIITTEISTGKGYDFTIVFGDAEENTAAYIDIDRAFANFALSEYGAGAAFGMFPGSTPDNPMLESEYPAKLYKGAEIEDIPFGWHMGDRLDFDGMAVFNGYVTSSTKAVFFSVPVGMPIFAKSATISGAVVLRGISGYLDNMSSGTGQTIPANGYTPTVTIANARAGLLRVVVSKSSAWSNVTNNTPVSVQAGSAGLTITFSDDTSD